MPAGFLRLAVRLQALTGSVFPMNHEGLQQFLVRSFAMFRKSMSGVGRAGSHSTGVHCALLVLALLVVPGISSESVHASGSVARTGQGVSIVDNRVFIDGVEVDPSTERYTSPTSGDTYRIRRNGDAVSVVLEKSGNRAGSGTTRIESHASGRGASVNAGQVVITTGK